MKALVWLRNSECRFLDIAPETLTPLRSRFPHIDFDVLPAYEDLEKQVSQADLVITWAFPPELYERAPRLKAVFTPAAGKEWIAPDPSGRVQVFHGGFHGRLMSETLLAMILYFNCRFHVILDRQTRRIWDRDAQWSMRRLRDQTVLFVGYGRIGRWCARVLRPFGCSMVGLRRQTTGGEDPETGVRCLTIEGIDDELRRADHVVLLLPGGAETHRFFRREYLSAMKRTAFLYNLGRGTVLAEEDLVWAIENRVLAGAGLDVFEQEPLPASSRLWGFRNVLILPHSSPAYAEYGTLFVEELVERFQGLGL